MLDLLPARMTGSTIIFLWLAWSLLVAYGKLLREGYRKSRAVRLAVRAGIGLIILVGLVTQTIDFIGGRLGY